MAVTSVVAWGMAALGAASAYSQGEMQKAQIKAQNQNIEANNQAALEQMQKNYESLNVEEQKYQKESLDQSLEVQKQAIAAEGRVNLMSAATGMQGTSVEDMFTSIGRDKGQSISKILGNFEDRQYEINKHAENVWQQTKGARVSKLKKPSGWSQAVNVGLGALQGYMTGSALGGTIASAAPVSAKTTGAQISGGLGQLWR